MHVAHPSSSRVAAPSKSVVQAIDRLARGSDGAGRPSKSVVEALDRLAHRIEPFKNLSNLVVAPYEKVLALQGEGNRTLHGPFPPDKDSYWYYDLKGTFTDLGGAIRGTGKFESVLSWFTAEVGPVVFQVPGASLAGPPYDAPPPDGYEDKNTADIATLGTTKSRLEFPDGSTIVSIGVNQTKIRIYADRTAQLFEANIEVIASGTGQFEGAGGLVTIDLGAYFNPLVLLNPTQEPYKSGYPVKVFMFIRLSTRPGVLPPSPPPPGPGPKKSKSK